MLPHWPIQTVLTYTDDAQRHFSSASHLIKAGGKRQRPLFAVVAAAIKATVGLRVSDDAEEAGLDIAEHGMYGYPEQFIPAPELVGFPAPSLGRSAAVPAPTTQEVPAS